MRARAAAILLAVAVALAAGCGSDGDPVARTLDDLFRAAEKRDASAVAGLLTADFQGADGTNRAGAEALARRYFAAYRELSVRVSGLAVDRGADAALARFQVRLSGTPSGAGGLAGLIPRDSSYRFEARLVPEGKRWKIAWASWAPLD